MHFKSITILFAGLFSSFFQNNEKRLTSDNLWSVKTFTIHGKAMGFRDSTKLYFNGSEFGVRNDSVLVMKESFTITGTYPEGIHVFRAELRTKDYSDYKFFYVEGEQIRFSAKKGDFRNASISGSPSQAVEDRYEQMIEKESKALRRLELPPLQSYGKDSAIVEDSIKWLSNRIIQELTPAFVKQHPDNIVSASLVNTYAARMGKTKTSDLFNRFSPWLKETFYGREIQRFLLLNKDVSIGSTFSEIEQQDQNGIVKRLSDLKGKYVLLEFWASWCGPCRRENPELVKTYKRFQPKGFEIFAVSVDQSRSMWLKAIQTDGLPWINVSELTGSKNSAAVTYGVYQYPTNFLIDPKGTIIAQNLRGEQLNKKLEQLFEH